MKTIFFSSLGQLFLITHNNNIADALSVKKYLINERLIKMEDIEIRNLNKVCHPTEVASELIGEFCVENNGELKIYKLDHKAYEKIYLRF